MEKHEIRLKRIDYLKNLVKFRNEKRPIIYTDETFIHSSHTTEKGWYDDSLKGLKKPISKGQRLIIVHAGGENGFIQDGLLIFKSGKKNNKKSMDYFTLYCKCNSRDLISFFSLF